MAKPGLPRRSFSEGGKAGRMKIRLSGPRDCHRRDSDSDNGNWYWSCTENRTDRSNVYNVRFTDGDDNWNSKDNYALSVRPV